MQTLFRDVGMRMWGGSVPRYKRTFDIASCCPCCIYHFIVALALATFFAPFVHIKLSMGDTLDTSNIIRVRHFLQKIKITSCFEQCHVSKRL